MNTSLRTYFHVHQQELAIGAKIQHGACTAYRCKHNHLFLVFGPHVFCQCKRRAEIYQCRCYGSANKWVDRVYCSCGAQVKCPAKIKARELEAAAAAFTIGGYAAAAVLLKADPGFSPRASGTYESGVPDDFPTYDVAYTLHYQAGFEALYGWGRKR